jgi:hypothetical protein
MARVSTDALRSAGRHLNNDENAFGLLRDSSGSLTELDELRARLEEVGYLYFKGFFPRESILEIRKTILTRMREEELILPTSNSLEARANPAVISLPPTQLMSDGSAWVRRGIRERENAEGFAEMLGNVA